MDYSQLEGWIWVNRDWLRAPDAKVHVLTHTLHYGTGVFEGVRAYLTDRGPAIFRLQDHTARLLQSAKLIEMQTEYTEAELNAVQVELFRRQGLQEGYIRPLLYYGTEGVGLGARELKSHALVAAWSWPSYLPKEAMVQGVRLITAKTRRPSPTAMIHHAKACGYYLNAVMARREADKAGCDEALMLDCNGNVAEGTGENVFLVRGGRLITPPTEHCLHGITRDTVIQLAAAHGIACEESYFGLQDVYDADEVFLTGTAAEVTPVAELDGKKIGIGSRGEMTALLQNDYIESVRGRMLDERAWLTYVDEASEVGDLKSARL